MWDPGVYSRAVMGKTDLTAVCYAFGKTPYMTDPAYAGKLLAVIKSQNLSVYDQIPQQPKPTAAHYKSIVDYLKQIGKDSSYHARAILAREHGIKNYTGTAAQNVELLHLLGGKK